MKRVLALLICLGFVASVSSQNYLQSGQRFVQFSISSSPIVAGGYFLTEGLALKGGIAFRSNGELDVTGLGLMMGIEKYSKIARLAPFMGGAFQFEINPNAYGNGGWKGSRATFQAFWGVHFYVVEQIALTGHVGADLQINSPKNLKDSINLGLFNSGLTLRIFF